MNRRRFLKTTLQIAGYGMGAGVLGLGGALLYVQPRKQVMPTRDPDDARRPSASPVRKKVVVVGGGLAGLVAGIDLAERNLDVTLIERAEHLGGKVGGWTVKALGEEFPVEHGFHGFFSQYYNLLGLLERVGATSALEDAASYPVLFPDRSPEVYTRSTAMFPFNMLGVLSGSPSMKWSDFRHDGPALYDLMKFDGEKTFERWDHTDFSSFAREGRINRPMVEAVLEPFGKTTLNRVGRLSAAEAIRFFHFYFMGNPEGLGFRYARKDTMSAIVKPLQRHFETLGGKVRTSTAARRLVRDQAGVTAVVVDAGGAPLSGVLQVHESQVPARAWFALPQPDGSAVYVGRRGARVVAFDGRCTHQGCPVAPAQGLEGDASGFVCPCHGGRFDDDGRPTGGPPRSPLRALVVRAEGERFAIGEATPLHSDEALACDHCIVAGDVRGVRRLIEASALAEPDLSRRVGALGESEPYLVLRLWLDKPVRPDRHRFVTCTGFTYTDSVAVYSAMQEPYIGWAKRTSGSVVEVHAYAIAPEKMASAGTLRTRMVDELRTLYPELRQARVLHEELQLQDNFTRWAPGDHATRPGTETPIPNLFLAGDHVRLDVPASLMEGAAISGRMAANAVLRHERLRETPIVTVPLKGPLA